MNCFKIYISALFCFVSLLCSGQAAHSDMSLPVDIGETGWNKVLCMKNGYTLLFHFEPEKSLTIKVFDTFHKKIASHVPVCGLLDYGALRTTLFKGLYDINGEAVLFLEQEHLSKHGLVRLRFNGKTGKLTGETLMAESKGINKPTRFFVMKNKEDDNYAILYSSDWPQYFECKLSITCFNNHHQAIAEIPLDVDRRKYDLMNIVGAESQPNGMLVTVGLSKLKVNGTPQHTGDDFDPTAPIYDHHLQMLYIPKGSNTAQSRIVDVSPDVYPYYANYTYNPFAKSLNLLMLSYKEALYKSGLELLPAALTANLFFKIEEETLTPHFNWMDNKIATQYLKQKTDTAHYFDGLPAKTFTNENGLTTVVSATFSRYNYNLYAHAGSPPFRSIDRNNRFKFVEEQTHQRSRVFETYIGNIGITQFDDDGNELWGIVLPCSQYMESHQRYYFAYEFAKRWQDLLMFGDWPGEVYNRQFLAFNTYCKDKNYYVICNDYDKNFSTGLSKTTDTVYSFENTNACVYKINKKKEVTKEYLLGEPAKNEYKTSFIEGADFDEQRGVYATLVQYKKHDHVSLRMAWSRLN